MQPLRRLARQGQHSVVTIIQFLTAYAASIQAALFGTVILGCCVMEAVVLRPDRARTLRRGTVNALFAGCVLPIQLVLAMSCLTLAEAVTAERWGLLYLLPGADSPWIKFGLMFIVLDLLDWVYHFAMHHVPAFWRFHLVHHTDQAIDASTTIREHPGETVIRNGFLAVWVVLCGIPPELLVLRQTIETVSNILSHTSFRLGDRWGRVLGWLLITPNLHHVHHDARLPYTNSNYGDVFSVWDRLFRTYRTLAAEDMVVGLDTHLVAGDHNFRAAVAMPFVGQPEWVAIEIPV